VLLTVVVDFCVVIRVDFVVDWSKLSVGETSVIGESVGGVVGVVDVNSVDVFAVVDVGIVVFSRQKMT
jgi:hypothetical protein